MRANAKFSLGAAALLAALAGSAIGEVRLGLSQVRASLQREGAAATVNRLIASKQWDAVLDGMASGEAGWISIAPVLARGADAGAAEELGIALAEALPRNAGAVLAVLDPQDGSVLGASRVCGFPFIEPQPGRLERYRPEAMAAVRAVQAQNLQASRDACLAALAKR